MDCVEFYFILFLMNDSLIIIYECKTLLWDNLDFDFENSKIEDLSRFRSLRCEA